MMSAQCLSSPRSARFRLAASALCAVFLLAASGCAPQKRATSTPLSAQSMNGAITAYQSGDCRESIRRFSEALRGQDHPALLNGLGMAYLECNQPQNAAKDRKSVV